MTEDQPPSLSVIIPSHNRARMLHDCLEALAQQHSSTHFEVVVVLDGCVDDSFEVARSFASRLTLTVLEQAQQGPAAARNRGAAEARGDTLLFIDDDILLATGAVEAHAQAQQTHGPAVVIGRIDTRATRRGLPRRSVAYWKAINRRHETGLPPTFLDCFTGNLSLRASALRNDGGFDERLRRSEDIELGYRLTQAGLPIVYAGGARAQQIFTKTTEEVLRDAEGFGRANVTLWKTYPEMRRFLHMGGVTSGIGLRSRLLPALAGLPLPMTAFRLLGAIPERVPGTGLLATWVQAYFRVRGVRKSVSSPAQWAQMTARLRVLRYTAFAQPDVSDGEAVSCDSFEQQLRVLRESDVDVSSLSDYVARLGSTSPPQRDTVVVTLEAPIEQLRASAFPALAKFGFGATAFLDAAAATEELPGGIEHGLRGEPGSALHALAALPGKHIASFAYPPGRPTPAEVGLVRSAGFRVACVASPGLLGWRTDPFLLPRVTVTSQTSLSQFRWMIRFGTEASSPPARLLSKLLFR